MRRAYEKFWKETRPLMVNEEVPMSPTQPYHVLHAQQLKARAGIQMWKAPSFRLKYLLFTVRLRYT